jgi:hypothetical protein
MQRAQHHKYDTILQPPALPYHPTILPSYHPTILPSYHNIHMVWTPSTLAAGAVFRRRRDLRRDALRALSLSLCVTGSSFDPWGGGAHAGKGSTPLVESAADAQTLRCWVRGVERVCTCGWAELAQMERRLRQARRLECVRRARDHGRSRVRGPERGAGVAFWPWKAYA